MIEMMTQQSTEQNLGRDENVVTLMIQISLANQANWIIYNRQAAP